MAQNETKAKGKLKIPKIPCCASMLLDHIKSELTLFEAIHLQPIDVP